MPRIRGFDGIFLEYTFKEHEIRQIEALIMNGMTENEIAQQFYSVIPNTWKLNLGRSVNHAARDRFRLAKEKAIGNSIENLRKLADGYTLTEKEFVVPFEFEKFEDNAKDIIELVKKKDWKGFTDLLLQMIPGKSPEDATVKVKQKEIAPDLNANKTLLMVLSPEVWDMEAKHKKIPQVKIIVGVEGEKHKLREGRPKKEIAPDYVVETQKK